MPYIGKAPTPYPNDGNLYIWDEENLRWNLINN